MKNRRTIVVAFLLVAVLTIGVGFAALTDTLTANGTVKALAANSEEVFDGDVYFSKTVMNAAAGSATINTDGDSDEVTISITPGYLKDPAVDECVITLTIANNSDLPVSIAIPTVTVTNTTNVGEESYFKVSTSWTTAQTIPARTATGPSTADVSITIKLNQTPVADQTAEFTVSFIADYVE